MSAERWGHRIVHFEKNINSFGCIVAQVYDQHNRLMHAVLYDEDKTSHKNDGKYYFKNSYPAEPYIIIPKNRVTYMQYEELKNVDNGQFRTLKKSWENQLGCKMTENLQPRRIYWTIYDKLFEISIRRTLNTLPLKKYS